MCVSYHALSEDWSEVADRTINMLEKIIENEAVHAMLAVLTDKQRDLILMVCEAFGGGVFTYVSQLCNDMVDEFDVYLAYSLRPQTPKNYTDFLDQRVHLIEMENVGVKGYKESDILQIVHLIDTDGAFIPDNLVKARTEKGIQYFEDHIETGEVKYIQGRNQKKSSVVASLCSTGKMKSKIPYSIYYFSRNMEHVLHNVATELTDDQKIELADAFADRYEENPMDFVAFIESEEVAVPGGYTQTWTFIREGTNSLNRHSNLRILFEQENLKSNQ